MFDNQATGKKLSRRGRTAAVATSVGAALLAVGIGMTPAAADAASPSRVATAPAARSAAPGLGSDNLIQSDDFFQQGLMPVGATVDLTGKQALSACSGETTMRTLTKGSASAYAGVTWTFDSSGSFLTESVADGSTDASAVSYENRLNKAVRSCQNEPAGHWHYGQGHALTVPAGEGTWYPAFNGDGEVTGGVAVIRGGHRFGIVELVGQPSDDPGYMKGMAATAINRLTD
ncbi:hypothetical protein [Streptomyces triticiradicis]|uniref:Sensor domain-containing protein n=1 Tax=Streptomyces triticiradicis TaxID=2651189 RepID=A0A7J5DAV9_9ACTN|nr:hypothetical protein [Streptomyces triticiradicis]KAB1985925.1 hypothetical protein F8144_25635 [Streptomyces triticiradicis]